MRAIAPSAIPPSSRGSLARRWSGSRPPDRHRPPSRYSTRVGVFLSLRFSSFLCEHNSLAEEADSLVSLWPAQHRFYNRRGGQSFTYNVPQCVAVQLPRRTKLQRVPHRVPVLPAVVTDVRRLPSDFSQVLAEHAVSREHLGHPVGGRKAAVSSVPASLLAGLGSGVPCGGTHFPLPLAALDPRIVGADRSLYPVYMWCSERLAEQEFRLTAVHALALCPECL